MRIATLILASLLATQPLHAQEGTPILPDANELEEWSREAQSALQALLEALRPRLEALQDKIGELDQYEAPVVLPNGDILIRRKPPADPDAPVTQPLDL